ncbi:hypothetical protein GE061_017223 [Apolygus lucorum]|uniref:Uncharacterized protein n=1 Tax=Apolygus lucorum TaxID=248454 RepID=A0A8S9XBR0_APOLU|nr:hypothetical protein GE061_017223 [Apolygus lucorum]
MSSQTLHNDLRLMPSPPPPPPPPRLSSTTATAVLPTVRKPTRPLPPGSSKRPEATAQSKESATKPLPLPPRQIMSITAAMDSPRPPLPSLLFSIPPYKGNCTDCCIHGWHLPRTSSITTQTPTRTSPPTPPAYIPTPITDLRAASQKSPSPKPPPPKSRPKSSVPHSTMKLLWAAVVVVSLVDAIDKKGFAKKTGFDVLEKKQNVVNLLTYIGNFANLYLEVAEKVVSVCEQSLPDKPEELRLIRRPLGDAKQALHDLGMKPIRQLLLEHKPAAKVKISKKDLEVWQRINEFGYQLAKAGDLLNKSSTNELPLVHYNDRVPESSKPLAEQKEDYKKAHVMMRYLHLMISSVAQTVYLSKYLPTYLKQHSHIALKIEKGEKAIKTTEENLSRLEKNLYSFSQGYMNALHGLKTKAGCSKYNAHNHLLKQTGTIRKRSKKIRNQGQKKGKKMIMSLPDFVKESSRRAKIGGARLVLESYVNDSDQECDLVWAIEEDKANESGSDTEIASIAKSRNRYDSESDNDYDENIGSAMLNFDDSSLRMSVILRE